MSDPRHRDPRLDPPPLQENEVRSQQVNELQSSNAMWGWVAGAVVLALVLMFVFTRGQPGDTTASNPLPPVTTGSAPLQNPAPPVATAPRPAPPTTTGSGSSQ